MDTHLAYPSWLEKRPDGVWQMSFRDVPEAFAEARTAKAAAREGVRVLGEAIQTRMEFGLEIPRMSRPEKGERVIAVPELED